MNLYIPCNGDHIETTVKRVWNLSSQPGSTLIEEIDLAEASGRVLMQVYFASLSHPDDKHWQSAFIPLNDNSDVGISLTWWARRAGLAGSTNIKVDTLGKWLSTLKSKIVGDYTINSIMCPQKGGLPSRTNFLNSAESHHSWVPSYGFDAATVLGAKGISADDFYSGMLTSNALIHDFLRFVQSREDIFAKIEEFQLSPLTCFGSEEARELKFLESLRAALNANLDNDPGSHGQITKGQFKPAIQMAVSVEREKPATKEELYAGMWGAFG